MDPNPPEDEPALPPPLLPPPALGIAVGEPVITPLPPPALGAAVWLATMNDATREGVTDTEALVEGELLLLLFSVLVAVLDALAPTLSVAVIVALGDGRADGDGTSK